MIANRHVDDPCDCQACEMKRLEGRLADWSRRWQDVEAFIVQRLEKYDVYWTTDAMKYRAFREMQDEMRRLT